MTITDLDVQRATVQFRLAAGGPPSIAEVQQALMGLAELTACFDVGGDGPMAYVVSTRSKVPLASRKDLRQRTAQIAGELRIQQIQTGSIELIVGAVGGTAWLLIRAAKLAVKFSEQRTRLAEEKTKRGQEKVKQMQSEIQLDALEAIRSEVPNMVNAIRQSDDSVAALASVVQVNILESPDDDRKALPQG